MTLSGLIQKEFNRIRSDRRTLILLFVIPMILIVIFGLTTGVGPTKFFTAAIISQDEMPTYENFPSNSSEYDEVFISIIKYNTTTWDLYRSFNATNSEEYNHAINRCLTLLKNDLIDVFIVLPQNFSESIANNSNPVLIYYIDGSDRTAVSAIEVSLQEPISLFRVATGMLENFTIMVPHLEFGVPSWESQLLNYSLSLILPIIIVGTTMNLTSLSIVAEGPLPRMLITPTSKRDILFSKLIANTVIMILQSTEIFVMTAFFGLYSLGSLFSFYLILLMIGLSGVAIGLFISAISPTEQGANQMYLMMFIVMIIFSGTLLPAESLGGARFLADLFPLSHASILITDVTLRGLSLNLEHVLSLLLISMIFLFAAYVSYKFKKLEV
ncbi:MAG: ABC transporter permease [Candidatus Lokiarchaeota archaeon]|nr:ABC transporter permease [Candidatus Lokiarchaeota archaeon]